MNIIPANKINASINSVVRALGKSGAALHNVAYSCLALIESSGDVRPLQRLFDALPGTVYKSALKSWAVAYGRVTVKFAEGDDAKARPIFAYAKGGESDLEGAAATPVMDFKPEAAAAKDFDLAAALSALLKKTEKNGAHLTHVAVYKMLTDAEAMLNGGNVIVTDAKAAAKAKRQAAEVKAQEAAFDKAA